MALATGAAWGLGVWLFPPRDFAGCFLPALWPRALCVVLRRSLILWREPDDRAGVRLSHSGSGVAGCVGVWAVFTLVLGPATSLEVRPAGLVRTLLCGVPGQR